MTTAAAAFINNQQCSPQKLSLWLNFCSCASNSLWPSENPSVAPQRDRGLIRDEDQICPPRSVLSVGDKVAEGSHHGKAEKLIQRGSVWSFQKFQSPMRRKNQQWSFQEGGNSRGPKTQDWQDGIKGREQ